MKAIELTVVTSLLLALTACSDSSGPSVPADDPIDANNYRVKLSGALDQLRADYFTPFIEAPASANRLFQRPLPDANEYFGPEPFPIGAETQECDNGSVTRDVLSSDAQRLTITASFAFEDCEMAEGLFNGTVTVELDGDSPSRLGGQRSRVVMQFSDVQMENSASPDTTNTLTGMFKTESGWGAAYIYYQNEYLTESYQEMQGSVDDSDVLGTTIINASYAQQLESDHLEADSAYYRLSESGALSAVVQQGELQAEYDISIDPSLIYSSQLNAQNLPVYSDKVLSGTVSYTQSTAGSVTASPSESTPDMIRYLVDDGINTFSEIDEWLFSIDCDDNSAMNRRSLCETRR